MKERIENKLDEMRKEIKMIKAENQNLKQEHQEMKNELKTQDKRIEELG